MINKDVYQVIICCPKNKAKMHAGTINTANGYSLFEPSFFDMFKISKIIAPKTEDKIIVKIVLYAPMMWIAEIVPRIVRLVLL